MYVQVLVPGDSSFIDLFDGTLKNRKVHYICQLQQVAGATILDIHDTFVGQEIVL